VASQKLRAVSGEEVSKARASMSLADSSTFGKATLGKLKKNLHADYVVSGSYLAAGSQADSNLNIDFSLQSASTGDTTDALHLSGAVSALPALVKQATAKLFAKFGVNLQEEDQAAAAIPENPEAARLYAQGLEKLRKFDTLAARDLFQRAISIEPNLALAHSALAESWSALGYDANAAEEAKKAFTLSKNLTMESRRIIEGRYYLLSSQWDEAIKTYGSLSGVYQDEPAYALELAHAQTRSGKGEDALATIKQLRANPQWKDDPRIDLQEAYAAMSLSDLAAQQRAAAAAAQEASRNGSTYLAAEAYWLECVAYQALGQFKNAEASCRQSYAAATSVPVYLARSQTVLATILEKQGKTSEALELRKSALRTAKDIHSNQDIIGALMNLANLQVSQGQLDEANKNYAEAFAVAKEIGDKQHLMYLQSEMASNLSAQGKLPESRNGYELSLNTAKEIGDKGGIADAYQNLASVSLQMGELSTAESSVQQSIAGAEKAGLQSTLAFSLGLWADILQARGNFPEARKKNEQAQKMYAALQQPSGVADCQLVSASLALENGNASEAEKLATMALHEYLDERLIPQEGEARNTLAQALLDQGKLSESSAALDSADKLPDLEQGTTLSLRITRAKWLARSGKSAEAEKLLKQALTDAQRLHFFGKELEIRLAQASALGHGATDLAALQQIGKDARMKGYLGIAHQADTLAR
jgi:tetratricopeptide (TPR) repeat protein